MTPPTVQEDDYPFWDYQDLALFAGAALPALGASSIAVALVRRMSGEFHTKAMEVLVLQCVAYVLWFLALYGLFHFKHGRPFWESLAWSGPIRPILGSMAIGPVVAIAVAVAGYRLATPAVDNAFQDLLTDRVSVVVMGVLFTTLGPLAEELAFRGFLLPLISRSLGPAAGITLAAAPFALLHGPQYGWSWRHMMLIGLAGVAFGWARFRTGSTAAAAAMHASYNLTFFAGFLIAEGDTISW